MKLTVEIMICSATRLQRFSRAFTHLQPFPILKNSPMELQRAIPLTDTSISFSMESPPMHPIPFGSEEINLVLYRQTPPRSITIPRSSLHSNLSYNRFTTSSDPSSQVSSTTVRSGFKRHIVSSITSTSDISTIPQSSPIFRRMICSSFVRLRISSPSLSFTTLLLQIHPLAGRHWRPVS
jgi:hypothetical protein